VTISDSTPGAVIYYTTNDTTPTTSTCSSTWSAYCWVLAYCGPISVPVGETIEAIAKAPGYSNSEVALGYYGIGASSAPANVCIDGTVYGLSYDDELTTYNSSKYLVGYPFGPYQTGAAGEDNGDDAYYLASQIKVTPEGLAHEAQPGTTP
jgi:hypothetical protein